MNAADHTPTNTVDQFSPTRPDRILTAAEVEARTTISGKQRRKMEAKGQFPLRVPLSPRLHGYLESEIDAWIAERVAERAEVLASRCSPNPLAKANRREAAKQTHTEK